MDLVTVLALCALHRGMRSLAFALTIAATPAHDILPRSRFVVFPISDTPARKKIDQWQLIIMEAARRFGVPKAWIRAVMQAESGGQPTRHSQPITSRAGAMGLMQVMPETYRDMARCYGLGSDPYDPRDNILAGAAYLRKMLDRFGYPQLFAAYNAGPERFDAYLRDGVPLPRDTWIYLAAIGPHLADSVAAADAARSTTLAPTTVARADNRSGTTLFFPVGMASTVFVQQPQTTAPDLELVTGLEPAADRPGRLSVPRGTAGLSPESTERRR